ncbi:MAG: universal stress protein [Leptolyngbyaceae cyanobacterium CRU_2_3]|nr:universal stress protein [Leptolyngbyaceae cyanobacterium CRU_2_3]
MFNRILVALDHSEGSQQIFEQALDLAKAINAQMLLLHVFSPLGGGYGDTPIYWGTGGYYPILNEEIAKQYAERWAACEHQGLERLRSLTVEAQAVGVTAEFTQTLGDPGRTICATARSWKANLILMGRRGHSGLNEWIIGSVSNYVTHHAPCSVLTVQHVAAETHMATETPVATQTQVKQENQAAAV